MNVSITLTVNVDNLGDLGPVQTALEEVGKIASLNCYPEEQDLAGILPGPGTKENPLSAPDSDYEEVDPPEAVDDEAAKKAKKAARAKVRRAEKAKAAADAAAADTEVDPLDELTGETEAAPEVDEDATEKDLHQAVKVAIEGVGIDKVREIFLTFKSKASKPCAKMSDVKEKDFGAVIAALVAAAE